MFDAIQKAIAEACPGANLRVGTRTDRATWTLDLSVSTGTADGIAAAQEVLRVYDDSPAADAARELEAAKAAAKTQTSTGVETSHLVERAIVGLMIDQINVLRTKVGLATITAAQVRVALDNKIQSLS